MPHPLPGGTPGQPLSPIPAISALIVEYPGKVVWLHGHASHLANKLVSSMHPPLSVIVKTTIYDSCEVSNVCSTTGPLPVVPSPKSQI